MGRKLFATGVKLRGIQIDALAKARSEAAMDRLLARPVKMSDRLASMFTHHAYRHPALSQASALADEEPVVRTYGFVPLAHLVVHAWFGARYGVEAWVDRTGSIVLEVGRWEPCGLSTFDGQRVLATYFTDGTSLLLWSSREYMERAESPTSESMMSCGYFPQDLRNFQARLAELVESGREVLHVWNVPSLVRRYELHNRYMVAPGTRQGQVSDAIVLFVITLVFLGLLFLVNTWIHPWATALALPGGFAISKVFRRLGLYLNLDEWVYRRWGL